MTHFQRAYGLSFESELALPELPDATGSAADIRISMGSVPEHLEEPAATGVLFEASPREFLLKMPGVARYLVLDGSEILVEPDPGAGLEEVRVFLLGTCIGALLHQRGVLVLHAAAIGTDRGAVLFAGASGAGKSTLLGELLRRGNAMVVDDVCGVTGGIDGIDVLPGYPRTRLWSDAASKLGVETAGLVRTRPSLEKFERQVPEQFWEWPGPMRAMYILTVTNRDDFEVERLPAVGAFGVVLANTYRRRFLEGLGMRTSHFELASQVAASVPIAQVSRPRAGFRLEELADLIESDLAR